MMHRCASCGLEWWSDSNSAAGVHVCPVLTGGAVRQEPPFRAIAPEPFTPSPNTITADLIRVTAERDAALLQVRELRNVIDLVIVDLAVSQELGKTSTRVTRAIRMLKEVLGMSEKRSQESPMIGVHGYVAPRAVQECGVSTKEGFTCHKEAGHLGAHEVSLGR